MTNERSSLLSSAVPHASPSAASPGTAPLSRADLETVLAVTRALGAPFDLATMLAEVTAAACQVLQAERASVWLLDVAAEELVLEVSSDGLRVRVPLGRGLVGACARERVTINVPDCYADARFDTSTDLASGFRTRCSLTLPLVDHRGDLVGVMQVLNRLDGAFDADDEALAEALAAQCAVALSRARMTEALVEGERMKQELTLARVVQMSTLPATMPSLPGYDMHATFLPADQTGGDTYDLSLVDQGLLILLGDATGHGIAPALSVTQMQAMLRMAFRLGSTLETAFREVNDRLAETLPDGRFITAFIGLLDATTHRLRFLSAGQAPILVHRRASARCEVHGPTSFPLGATTIATLKPAVEIDLGPGDWLALVSDGILEHENGAGEQFGRARVQAVLARHVDASAADLARHVLDALRAFAGAAAQDDDVTMVLLKRAASTTTRGVFARRTDALPSVVAFTATALGAATLTDKQRHAVDFAIEELFTNMVKYAPGGRPEIAIGIDASIDGVEITLIDGDVPRFDPTQAPEAATDAPLDARTPGGLGLQLVRKLVDAFEYDYDPARLEGRTRVRVGRPVRAATPTPTAVP